MSICVYGISALELYRSSGRLLPDLLDGPRVETLAGCSLPPRGFLQDDMERAGVRTRPYHVLVSEPNAWREREDVVCHKLSGSVPGATYLQASRDLLVVCPELMFVELAASGAYDVLDLVEIGYELCGTYVLDGSWDGFTITNRQIAYAGGLRAMADAWSPRRGARLAREAARLVHNGAHSPMETVVAMLLSYPQRYGGLGLSSIQLNVRCETPDGPRHPDILIPEAGVVVEYKGLRYHSAEQAACDDRRQNALVGAGYAVINVWYEDVVEGHLYERLVASIFRALGRRHRPRAAAIEANQLLLRHRLLPRFRALQGGCDAQRAGAQVHMREGAPQGAFDAYLDIP